MSRIYVIFHDCLLSYTTVCYIRFSSVGLNRLKNELLAEYLKKITVGQSCEYQRPALLCCQITFSKCKYNTLSGSTDYRWLFYKTGLRNKKMILHLYAMFFQNRHSKMRYNQRV